MAILLGVGGAMGRGDAPRAVARDIKVYSHNKRFFAVSLLKEQRTAVFPASAPYRAEWEMPGYWPVLFLSDDGQHLVEGCAGGNILAADAKDSDALLVFFWKGQRVGVVTVGEMFPKRKALPETASGWAWGNFWGFEGPNSFVLLLYDERKVAFDVRTGKRIP